MFSVWFHLIYNFMLRKDRAIWKIPKVKFITGFISMHMAITLHSIILIHRLRKLGMVYLFSQFSCKVEINITPYSDGRNFY